MVLPWGLWDSEKIDSKEADDQEARTGWRDEESSVDSGLEVGWIVEERAQIEEETEQAWRL